MNKNKHINYNIDKESIYDVIIIGGGASGMMAGCVASGIGKKVLIIEKNLELGSKLKISGGGRCNITNATYNIHDLLEKYGESKKILYSPFSIFGIKDTFDFFENLKLPLVVQAENRAFPYTEKALDVYNAMLNNLIKNNVQIKTKSKVLKIVKNENNTDVIDYVIVKENNLTKKYYGSSFILSTGGLSHPETGSTGDGFSWLRDLGHSIINPTPNIVPLITKEKWSHIISGVSVDNAKITFYADGVKKFSKIGRILFTHFGLSGPTILNSSIQVSDLFYSSDFITAKIDCYPGIDESLLDQNILKILDLNKNKVLKNVIKEIIPQGLLKGIEVLLFDSVDLNIKTHSLSKDNRKKITRLLKELPLTIRGLEGFDKSVVADGGVPLSEIDTKTMRSKYIKNLCITGDLLNVRRPTGGYSLQLCWTTGYIAGKSV